MDESATDAADEADARPWPDETVAPEAERNAQAADDEDDAIAPLVLNIEGFEGPLDALLALARTQKVDLKRISILELADQYLEFMAEAKARRLELAADYLVMAAWLAYLKSRLLLPEPEPEDEEPTGEELAARLAYQLQRLQAMRKAGEELMARPLLGRDVMGRGAPEGVRVLRRSDWTASLYDLLRAYSDQRIRTVDLTMRVEPLNVFTIEAARQRLEVALGAIPDWSGLEKLIPEPSVSEAPRASVFASTLSAVLELARDGHMELRQLKAFGPVYVRSRPEGRGDAAQGMSLR
ncbi:MAG: ScpA family protein [Pseudomonadota bacterium]